MVQRDTIAIPALDIQARPELVERRLRNGYGQLKPWSSAPSDPAISATVADEVELWFVHQQVGTRSEYSFGHSFGKWWDKYHESHPDYFAVPPAGATQPSPQADRVKLCVSNPAVADQIIAEWKAAGMPDNWNVCPNDGGCFCSCARCRQGDGLGNEDPEAAWHGDAQLTGRYVALWNGLLRRMKQSNPRATLSSYAYSAYRDPLPGMNLEPGMALEFVLGYDSYDHWNQWHAAGAKMVLRPNWWHMGSVAPHLPLHAAGDFFRFARGHSMVGYNFDTLLGYWGAQGPYYYLIARLGARPEFTVDDCIAEYCAAFGKGAPAIRDYLDYWEDYAQKIRDLHRYRDALTPRHVVWGDTVTGSMRHRGIRPESSDRHIDLEGL